MSETVEFSEIYNLLIFMVSMCFDKQIGYILVPQIPGVMANRCNAIPDECCVA